MNKASSIFSFARLCLSNTSEVLKNLYNFTEETTYKNLLLKKYGLKEGVSTIDLLDLFPDFNERIEDYTYLDGSSQITDIAILKQFARKFPKGRYLEFGTWRGESISNVSDIMEECISISFSEEEMKQYKINENAIRVSRFFSRNKKNIRHIEHNSQNYDFSILEKTCDLIFVDADHKYEGVKKDTENAFRLLKDKNSVIVWHDSGRALEGLVNWQVQAGILDGAPGDEYRKKIHRVSNSLCAVYMHEDFKAGYPVPYYPNKKFSVTIHAKNI